MSYKNIDFSEPIPDMITRLVAEHKELVPKLNEIGRVTENEPNEAIILLEGLKKRILQHAIEEEARLMRVIMKDAKPESADSIKIMQDHRWISEFLEHRTKMLHEIPKSEAQIEIQKFVADLKQHFMEEEIVVFPLAHKAQAVENFSDPSLG